MNPQNPQEGALNWLFEMELIKNPAIINSMVLNIKRLSKAIKDVHFITDEHNKKLLIYVKIQFFWFRQKAKEKVIIEEVTEMFDEILPAWKKRVISDRVIFDKALKIINDICELKEPK